VSRKSRTRLLVATGVLLAVFAGGVIWMVKASSASYYHVADLGSTTEGQQVKVSGRVQPGTIQRDAQGIHFLITEDRPDVKGSPTVKVDYTGQMPASLKDESLVIVVGKYAAGGITASSLQTKCPSKYETQAASPAPAATP
jgi:cytochrome c-type biogenesis protein CcmE